MAHECRSSPPPAGMLCSGLFFRGPSHRRVYSSVCTEHHHSMQITHIKGLPKYITLPLGWAGCWTCPALRPCHFGPKRIPECTHKVTGNGCEAVVNCEAKTGVKAGLHRWPPCVAVATTSYGSYDRSSDRCHLTPSRRWSRRLFRVAWTTATQCSMASLTV